MRKALFSIFLLITTTKIVLSLFISSPHIVFDESILFIEAQKIWHEHTYFTGRWLSFPQYPPLYPLLISFTTALPDPEQSFRLILILNSIISTSAVFPAYYLAKEYLTEKKSLITTFLVALHPPGFIYTFTIMCENLFIPLILTSIYFMKKSFDEDTLRANTLAGLFLSLSFLTKLTAIPVIVIYIGGKLWQIMADKKRIRTAIGIILIILTISAYFLANTIHYSNQPQITLRSSATGYGTDPIHAPGKDSLALFFSYILYLVLAGGGIAFMAFFTEYKRFRLFWLIILTFIPFISYAMPTGMIHGRYLDPFIPLMIIGALGYRAENENKRSLLLAFTISLTALWFFPFFWMDTINSSANIYLLNPCIRYTLAIIFSVFFLFLLEARTPWKVSTVIAVTLLILFLTNNAVNYQFVKTASTNAYEYCKIGRYINEHNLTSITFDKDDYRDWWSTYCLINFWSRHFIPLETTTNISSSSRYFISSKNLSYPVLASEKSFYQLENINTTLYLYQKVYK